MGGCVIRTMSCAKCDTFRESVNNGYIRKVVLGLRTLTPTAKFCDAPHVSPPPKMSGHEDLETAATGKSARKRKTKSPIIHSKTLVIICMKTIGDIVPNYGAICQL